MKKLLVVFALAVVCRVAFAQTTTPNVGLYQPAIHQQNWGPQVNNNWTIIDNLLSGVVAIPALKITGNLTVGGTCTGCGGSGSVNVNGSAVSNPNFNVSSPLADAGFLSCTWKTSGSSVIVECPYGTSGTTFVVGNDSRIVNAVQNTTTINTHALSSNVVVSASDLTTGTLPHAQLPLLLSGDIPNNAANTSGTAASFTGNLAGDVTGPQGTTVLAAIQGKSVPTLASGYFHYNGTAIVFDTPSGSLPSGPTSPNGIAQTPTSTPSGGVAGAVTWSIPGVAIDAQTGTSYTIPITDDVHLLTGNNASATAWTGFALANNYTFAFMNLGAGLITYTPASGTVNGNATQIVPFNWFGFHYTDNTNTRMPVMPTIQAFPNCPDSTGNHLNFTSATGALGCGTSAAPAAVVPTVVDTSSPVTVSTTNSAEFHYNENATAGTAMTYNLPTAAAGKQFCISNAYNGTAANTGVLTVATSAAGQFIIFTDGTLSATGGNVTSGGAAADAACVAGVDATHWMLYVQRGTWTKH